MTSVRTCIAATLVALLGLAAAPADARSAASADARFTDALPASVPAWLATPAHAPVAERASVERISFSARPGEEPGYVVRVHTTGPVAAYGEPRVEEGAISWKLYNTGLVGTLQAASAPGPVASYRAERQGEHVLLRFDLGAESRRGVAVDAYRDRASDDLLMSVTYAGDAPPPARVASSESGGASRPQRTSRSEARTWGWGAAPRERSNAAEGERVAEGTSAAGSERAAENERAAEGSSNAEARPSAASSAAAAPPSAADAGERTTAGTRWKFDTVVIDAGHGGHDPGAQSHGLDEKDVVLGIAKKLGGYIEERLSGVNVVYTRSGDRFVTLRDRGRVANKAQGDLFISIHANAAHNRAARGTETYFLGSHKTDAARKVMKRENSVIQLEDNPGQYENLTDGAMQEVMQSVYMGESEYLSGLVEEEFERRADRESRGVKQAGFLVLWAASMPAILVETGFVTNQQEARFLASERGQDLIASGIFRAVRTFKEQYEKGLNVAAE